MRKWNKPVQGIDTAITCFFRLEILHLRKWNKPVQGIDTL